MKKIDAHSHLGDSGGWAGAETDRVPVVQLWRGGLGVLEVRQMLKLLK